MKKEIAATEIKGNLIEMISKEWMLICAKDNESMNMMTASWGFVGEMWNKDCVICAVRPTRYTYECLENEDYFSLCFIGDNRDAYKICGTESGRDVNKLEKTGLSAEFDLAPFVKEAHTVIICKKLYADNLREEKFIDSSVAKKNYNNDFHRMYYGEIIKVLVEE